MSDPVVVALIVGGMAVAGQIVVGAMAAWSKREDWRRQDVVAARLVANDEKIGVQLVEIHGLVNSTLTRSMESELAGARRELLLAQELGRPQIVIDQIGVRIGELSSALNDRAMAT